MALDRDTLRQLDHLLRPLRTRLANAAARAVVKLVSDGTQMQGLQIGVLKGETIEGAEHFQPYGFSSVPLAGAEGIALFPNGDRGHPLVVAVADRRYRPTGGEAGDVTMYHHTGAKVTFTTAGDVVAEPASGRAVLLGSDGAIDGAIKGTTRDTAEQTFLAAMTTFVTAIVAETGAPTAAKTAFLAAITAFASAAGAAVSTKVKIE